MVPNNNHEYSASHELVVWWFAGLDVRDSPFATKNMRQTVCDDPKGAPLIQPQSRR